LLEESSAFFTYLGRDDRATYTVAPTPSLILMAQRIAQKLRALAFTVKRAAMNDDDNIWTKRLEKYAKRIDAQADIFKIAQADPEVQDGFVLFVERSLIKGQKPLTSLKAAPISVAGLLRNALWNRWPTVATSATLSTGGNFKFMRSRTGCGDARELSVESPFDFKSNALIYLPVNAGAFDPSKFYGAQEGSIEYFDTLSNEIERLLLASDGRAFCLFTSRRVMDQVYERIAHRLRWQVLRQGEYSTQETIKRFRADGHAVLFGLRTFMTGVDVQGEALSLVIVDKLPFPSPDEPVYAARCEALNREKDDKWAWFHGLAIPLATMTLKQGVGRLIRTKTDRGVIALLDGRLTL
jgi:ATP-dependent DNA helicase DinG